MLIPDELKDSLTECYVQGHLKNLTLEQAYVLFWEMPFAWLSPIEWLKFGKQTGYVRDLMTTSIKFFARNLLTRGYTALAENSECMLDEHGYGPSKSNFQAKACRLSKKVGHNLKFIHEVVSDRKKGGRPISTYRMLPGSRWLIVEGFAAEAEIKPCEFDWTIFQTPPEDRDKKVILKNLNEKGYL